MNDLLKQFGLNEKEANVYLILLENKAITVAQLAKLAKESRTNTYMILDKLLEMKLVVGDDSKVKRFNAVDPNQLNAVLVERQQELKRISAELRSALPSLSSKYRLAHHKPGVIYTEGLEGFKESLEDVERTGKEVLIIPSDTSVKNAEAFSMLLKALQKRKVKGVKSRIILHEDGRQYKNIEKWPKERGVEVRFLGERAYEGEVVVYGDKCLFVTYAPELINTTITNKVIAETMRSLFENIWDMAKP
ncbi:MAG: hypothetical protein M3P98_02860 [bacterium]|nr:hypothetical protein [bacterium]